MSKSFKKNPQKLGKSISHIEDVLIELEHLANFRLTGKKNTQNNTRVHKAFHIDKG